MENDKKESSQLERVRKIYDRDARFYDLSRRIVLTHRKRAMDVLNLREGQAVLEVGCGTGENFPYLHKKVGESGKIIGVEYSEKMLDVAREKITKRGYQNIQLHQADAAQFKPSHEINAALFADVLFVIPDFRLALKNAIAAIETEGRVSILDFKLSDNPVLKVLNGIWRKWSNFYGGDFGRRPWENLEELLGRPITMEEHLLGFRYIAHGTKE
ncbi:methyltransferase domain-containing protein [Candidatus Peregrinibacteria bacterium]|nr:methyltransferase domain-containing protein [Candidatus Peregrinibacteria bacterium]